jgi:hypothetical protein
MVACCCKIFESKLSIHIEEGTLIEEIYSRVAQWVGIISGVISLSGRLYPGGPKIKNNRPNIVAREGIN